MRNRTVALASLLLATFVAPVTLAEESPRPGEAEPSVALERFEQAKALATAGKPEAAMEQLQAAIASGFQGYYALRNETALESLRPRDDWAALMQAFETNNPWVAAIDTKPREGTPWTQYAMGWQALAAGRPPRTRWGASESEVGFFGQLQAQRASLVGDYDYAHANYFGGIRKFDAAESGIVRLAPALPALAPLVEGRNVVMLNESHGFSNQRAANFMLVRELRRLGFTHLALEALSYERTTDDPCRSSVLRDAGLQARGYPIENTGFYLDDPIYAELVRMAITAGYTLVAYDHTFPDPSSPEREQAQARNIACVLEESPEARIVVIGGGGHINKAPSERMEGGMMGRRLAAMLPTEPLAITNGVADLQGLELDETSHGYAEPGRDGDLAGQPYFAYTEAGPYAPKGYDLSTFIPVPAPRSAEAGWLRLGGWRVPAPAVELACEQAPCLLEARRVGEDPLAIPGDRCVIEAAGGRCQLFLAPGDYEVRLRHADGSEPPPARLAVPAPQ